MEEKTLLDTFSSMEKKLGSEAYAKISDDIGTMITANSEAIKSAEQKDAKIQELQATNEALIASNGNLLKQVSMAPDPSVFKPEEREEPAKSYDLRNSFDEYGNLKI